MYYKIAELSFQWWSSAPDAWISSSPPLPLSCLYSSAVLCLWPAAIKPPSLIFCFLRWTRRTESWLVPLIATLSQFLWLKWKKSNAMKPPLMQKKIMYCAYLALSLSQVKPQWKNILFRNQRDSNRHLLRKTGDHLEKELKTKVLKLLTLFPWCTSICIENKYLYQTNRTYFDIAVFLFL